MDIVDRYVGTVKRYLSAPDRDDIVAELSANIYAEIEDRERGLGRALDLTECEAILSAHGNPIAVALRYRGAGASFTFGRQIVGPALFPSYVRVLAINVLVACVVAVVAAWYDIPTWLGVPNILAHVFLQFTVVTIVFASIQAGIDGPWRDRIPQRRPIGAPAPRVSRLESISTLIWFVGSNVWFVDIFRSNDLFLPERGGSLFLTPVWHQIVLPYAIVVALELVRNAVNLARPEMVRFRALMICAASAVSFVGLTMLLRGGPLVAASLPVDAARLGAAHAVGGALAIGLIITAASIPFAIAWQIRTLVLLRRASATLAVAVGIVGLALFALAAPARANTSITSASTTDARWLGRRPVAEVRLRRGEYQSSSSLDWKSKWTSLDANRYSVTTSSRTRRSVKISSAR